MKKHIVKALLLIFVLASVLCLLPTRSYAASITYYETNKASVPIWSQSNSSSTKVRTIAAAGTVVKVVSSVRNSHGNVWYKLSDGNWVYSGNVKSHSHSLAGGVCTAAGCGYEYPLSITSMSGNYKVVVVSAKIWTKPYSSGSSVNVRTVGQGANLQVTGKTTNAHGNVWYRLSDGNWIFSDYVKPYYTITYNANGGSGAPSFQTVVSGSSLTLSTGKPTRSGYIFQGWSTSSSASSASYKSGSSYTFSGNTTLYAVWKKCTHNYDDNGGVCKTCGNEYTLSITSLSARFKVTNGEGAKIWSKPYSTGSSKNVRIAMQGTILDITGSAKNAQGNLWYRLSDGNWVYSGNVKQCYNITFNANGGSGAPGTQVATSGSSLKLSSTKPTRVGYIFQGWATSSGSSTVSYKAGSSYTFTKNTTLYAVWKACSHNYENNGGICKTCNYEYKLSITSLSANFKIVSDGGAKIWSKPYSTGSSKHVRTEAKNATLTIIGKATNAHGNLWYKLSDGNWVYSGSAKQCFTVTFNANGGKSAPKAQTATDTISLKLSSTKPTRVGYTFQGWSTSSSSSKVTYKAGSSYTFSKNITLYAVWKKCSHSTYSGGICTTCNYEYPLKETACSGTFQVTNDNGAPVWSRPYSTNSKKVTTYDKNAKLKIVAKVTNINSKGKSANVWYKLEDGNWVFSEHVTQRFSVKYDANGGKNAPSTQYFLSGKTATISSTKPTRSGYIFQGWATSASSSKVSYESGDKYSKTKNLTLYAVWKKCSHKYNSKGVCSSCKQSFKLTLDTSAAGTYAVTSSAPIRATPYSADTTIRTAKKNELLTVTAKATNAQGNIWYKLSDGNWVYSENVAKGYKVTYNANGGTGAPAASGFPSGKLVVSSKIPTRSGYIFQGWATSASATKASYNTGDSYNTKKNITLYAVWKKCNHDYKNNYGICKTCKLEFPLVVETVDDTVYSISNKNGTTSYKRPYSKSSEKSKTIGKNKLVLVVGSATNANGEVWLKLNDNSWIKKSDTKKCDTYNTIGAIPYKYALVMIGDDADGGLFSSETVGGVVYLKFFDSKNTFYVKYKAFEGVSKNSQLSTVNKNLSNAVNNRTSKQETFVYHTKTTKTVKANSYGCGFNNLETHKHIIWEISALTAKAGITGSDGVFVRCQNDGKTAQIEYCLDVHGIDSRWSHPSTVYPKFTVSTSTYAVKGEAVGWFTDFRLKGNGFKSEKFKIADYIDLFSSAIKGVVETGKFVVSPTPSSAFNALKANWKFATSAISKTKSTAYSSDINELTYEKNGTAYRTYKICITSPINLRSAKDYLEATIYTHKLNKEQTITVSIAFT